MAYLDLPLDDDLVAAHVDEELTILELAHHLRVFVQVHLYMTSAFNATDKQRDKANRRTNEVMVGGKLFDKGLQSRNELHEDLANVLEGVLVVGVAVVRLVMPFVLAFLHLEGELYAFELVMKRQRGDLIGQYQSAERKLHDEVGERRCTVVVEAQRTGICQRRAAAGRRRWACPGASPRPHRQS
jgi:hypothetical protein